MSLALVDAAFEMRETIKTRLPLEKKVSAMKTECIKQIGFFRVRLDHAKDEAEWYVAKVSSVLWEEELRKINVFAQEHQID